MINNYQEQEKLKQPIPAKATFATVGGVYPDGIALIFDGTTLESEKHYKANTAISFSAGQRVKLFATSGTYIVEYPIS